MRFIPYLMPTLLSNFFSMQEEMARKCFFFLSDFKKEGEIVFK